MIRYFTLLSAGYRILRPHLLIPVFYRNCRPNHPHSHLLPLPFETQYVRLTSNSVSSELPSGQFIPASRGCQYPLETFQVGSASSPYFSPCSSTSRAMLPTMLPTSQHLLSSS